MSCCGVVIMPLDLPASPQLPRRPFEVTGRLVLGSLVGFFLVVAGVNATMMTVAIRTMPGVDVKSAYESSQHFNTEFDRMRTQDQRGWQAEGTAQRQGDGAVISLRLRDRLGARSRALRSRPRSTTPPPMRWTGRRRCARSPRAPTPPLWRRSISAAGTLRSPPPAPARRSSSRRTGSC